MSAVARRAGPGTIRRALFGRETLLALLIVGVPLALGMAGVLPKESIVLAFPAIVATLLADTFLYNSFLIDTGVLFYAILAVFVYAQAVGLAALVRWGRART